MSQDVVLSHREPPFNGWVAIDEFENLLARLGHVRIAVPKVRRPLPGFVGQIRDKSLGPFAKLDPIQNEGELLLVVAHTPGDLRMLSSMKNARKRFRYIAGYVIDSYFTEDFGPSVKEFDHIFSTTEEGADEVRKRFMVSSSVLRQGFDCLHWACADANRGIDLLGFGRQPPSYHMAFQRAFHTHHSPLLYLHSPIGTLAGEAVWRERPMLLKLLQRSKLSLAFHLLVEPISNRPRSPGFVTSRWFESLASGCIVVGRRPPGAMADELFGWPDALIELPDQPDEAVAMIQSLASDDRFVDKTRRRNVVEMCERHDWRYRIRNIYEHFQLQLPDLLVEELALLEDRTLLLRSEKQSSLTDSWRNKI
jgi:Glycosyl transferases group 1